MKPTMTILRPAATSASRIRSHASCVVASGFSQNTCLPAAMLASTYSSCVGPHEQTTTVSTSGASINSWPLLYGLASARPSATVCVRSKSVSLTAVTRAPDRTWVSLRMWSWPIIPTPMTPTLTVMKRVPSRRSRAGAAGAGPTRDRRPRLQLARGVCCLCQLKRRHERPRESRCHQSDWSDVCRLPVRGLNQDDLLKEVGRATDAFHGVHEGVLVLDVERSVVPHRAEGVDEVRPEGRPAWLSES